MLRIVSVCLTTISMICCSVYPSFGSDNLNCLAPFGPVAGTIIHTPGRTEHTTQGLGKTGSVCHDLTKSASVTGMLCNIETIPDFKSFQCPINASCSGKGTFFGARKTNVTATLDRVCVEFKNESSPNINAFVTFNSN